MALLQQVLEGTLPLSFARPGFRSRRERFVEGDLDVDMRGKVCLVTGGNAGLGRATARALGKRGATVHLLCRSRSRGEEAAAALRLEAGNPRFFVDEVDIADQVAVRRFAERFDAEQIDVLVHNAGVLLDERQESSDAIELTWATAVTGPFLLTWLLAPKLREAEQGRVIFVSSGGMYTRRLRLDDWQWARRSFDGVAAYALAKRAQVVLSELWAEVLASTPVTVNAMHPGWASTGGVQRSLPIFYNLTKPLLRSAEEGADTVVWLAMCSRLGDQSGAFYFDRAAVATHKLPWTKETEQTREGLWRLCAELCGLDDTRLPI